MNRRPAALAAGAVLLAAELKAHRGRVVVLTMWATWCEPCRDEFPVFVTLDRSLRARGLSVLAVSLDAPSSLEKDVRPFLASHDTAFGCFIKSGGDDDAFINAIDPAWSGALPATFVYDPAGRRIHSFLGPITIERLTAAVTPLLPR